MATKLKVVRKLERQIQLRISLLDVVPLVWRSVVVPETITLPRLHGVIQQAMGWEGGHLHEFVMGTGRYGEPDPDFDLNNEVQSEQRVKLAKAMAYTSTFEYLYDFGDDWRHLVQVEDYLPGTDDGGPPVRCVAGANACPPEDVGGLPGYAEFLAAINNPKHAEHDHYLSWAGGSFDPRHFDLNEVNERLAEIKA